MPDTPSPLRVLGRLPGQDGAPLEKPTRTRVLVAVPHAATRAGIRDFLRAAPDLDLRPAVTSGADVLRVLRTRTVDVLLLDTAIADPDALEVLSRLCTEQPGLAVLFLATTASPDLPLRALELGAAGHLDGRAEPTEYVAAVRTVARGERYLSPLVRDALLARTGSPTPAVPSLTAREFQVLRLLAQGLGNDAIAESLAIAPSTVRSFKARLRDKLDLGSDMALARFAMDRDIG